LQQRLRRQLLDVDPTGAPQRRQQLGLVGLLLPTLAEDITATYDAIDAFMAEHSLAIAVYQADALVDVYRDEAGVVLATPWTQQETLTTALRETPFPSATQGNMPSALAAAWWLRQGQALSAKVEDQVRAGALAQESAAAIGRRLTGTPAQQGKDGVMGQALRSAEVVAEAQAAMATTQAVEAVATANLEAVAYLEHSSIMDNRTSTICTERDGKRFDAGTHEPIGHNLPYLSGPQYHMNCRSQMLLVLTGTEDVIPLAPGSFPQIIENATPAMRLRLLGAEALRRWEAKQLTGPALVRAAITRPLTLEIPA
jgi:hypothetical protein